MAQICVSDNLLRRQPCGGQSRQRQRHAPVRQTMGQFVEHARQAVSLRAGRASSLKISTVGCTGDAPRQPKQCALDCGKMSVQGFIIGKWAGTKRALCRVNEAEQPRARQPMSADDRAHGIGDGMAAAHDCVGALQTVVPPLQTHFTQQRLARGREGNPADLGCERGKRQQITADCPRRQQRGKIAIGFAGARGGGYSLGIGGRGWDRAGHVSRGELPPPWPA
jgi:hypothetical protein